MIPRLRGAVGQIDGGPDDGKFVYQLSLWDLSGEKQFGEPFTIGPFDSEEEAKAAGKKATRLAADKIVTLLGGEPDGNYIDLKNGAILRPWEEQ